MNWSDFANGSKTRNCRFVHRGAKGTAAAEQTVASAEMPPLIHYACRFVSERSKSPQSVSRNEVAQLTSGAVCLGHSIFRRAGLDYGISAGLSDMADDLVAPEAAPFGIAE
jgi:hypothetical protein